jgi:hypothetical protein
MSDDLTRTLEPLRGDLARAGLPDPSAVRRRGERRRITVVVTAALAVALVLGGAVGAASYLAAAGTTTVPPASGPASPDGSAPTRTDGPAPTSQPPRPTAEPTAGLAPETAILPELRGPDGYQTALEYRTYLSPPRPCERPRFPSDAHPRLHRPAHGMVADTGGPGPTVQMEYVVRYLDGSDGAKAYLADLRSDIRACPGRVASGMGRGDHKWSIVESGFAGDDSVLVRLRGSGRGYDASACCTDFYLAVVRDGEIVVALTDLGWEGGGGDAGFAKQSAGRALECARSLR